MSRLRGYDTLLLMAAARLAIIGGVRTPFSKAGTNLAGLSAVELGRIVTAELLERTGLDPARISQVIFGNVLAAPDAVNPSRVIAVGAGIPATVPAVTVQRNCASGFESLTSAYEKLVAGQGDIFVVGGVESMSHWPAGAALTDLLCGLRMGETAELLYREFPISRSDQDAFALASHQKAIAAREKLQEEIVPVYLRDGRVVQDDNTVRADTSLAALAALPPVFARHNGSVTAGNAAPVTDGAVALLAMSAERATEWGLEPLGWLRGYAVVGLEPRRMGLGPALAIPAALENAGVRWKELQLLEINEAFAVQVLAVLQMLREEFHLPVNRDLLNVNGGALALGHPVGASGARLVLTLLKEMQRRHLRLGLAALCVGGGQGMAVVLECEP